MNRKINLIYFSATGVTSTIVNEIGNGISDNVNVIDITLSSSRQKVYSFHNNDIVIIGIPVYGGRVPAFLTEYLSCFKGDKTKAVFVVTYGNRAYEDALLELKDTFEANGFIGIAAGAFIGVHSYTLKVGAGRPDAADLAKARAFGEQIRAKLNAKSTFDDLLVDGHFPYKERKPSPAFGPVTNQLCDACGICSSVCPMGAIDTTDHITIDAEKCIRCCRCIRECPQQAKVLKHEYIDKIVEMLEGNFSVVRCEPELFI